MKYRSFKEMPLWLKLLKAGILALLAFMLLLPLVSFEDRRFDAAIEAKIERIHAQMARGEFRQVFLEADRELIAGRDEGECILRLAAAQKYIAANSRKTGGDSAHYATLADKLKRIFGKPSLIRNYRLFESEAGRGSESFYWIVRGDGEIRLADYEFQAY